MDSFTQQSAKKLVRKWAAISFCWGVASVPVSIVIFLFGILLQSQGLLFFACFVSSWPTFCVLISNKMLSQQGNIANFLTK